MRAKKLTKISWIVIGRTVKAQIFQVRQQTPGVARVYASALGHHVEVVEHVEQGRARLVYRAYDRASTTRQRPQKFDALLRCHDI